MIYRVMPESIASLWDQLEPLITSALRGTPTHDAEDVRNALMGQRAHLFADIDGTTVNGLMVTEFTAYPKGTWLNHWLAAAQPDHPMDWNAFIDVTDAYRKACGCRGLQILGSRLGWLKRLSTRLPSATVEGFSMRWTETDHG